MYVRESDGWMGGPLRVLTSGGVVAVVEEDVHPWETDHRCLSSSVKHELPLLFLL